MIFEWDPSSGEPRQTAGAPSTESKRRSRKPSVWNRASKKSIDREAEAAEFRFIFVRWPSGSCTIALDRDYDAPEMEEF